MHPERRKILYNISAIVLVFETLYLIGANWFLRSNSFMEVLNINNNPEHLSIRIDSPKTYWPGDVRLKGFEISGHDGPVMWHIKTGALTAQLTLSSLLHRTLEVDSVDISSAQVTVDLWQPRLPPTPKSSKDPFWLKFHKLRIRNLEHVRIHSYRYSGTASINGSFELWPGRELNIWNADINVKSGDIRRENNAVLKDMRGSLEASLLKYLPQDDDGLKILDRIKSASLDLKGILNDSSFVNFYMKGVPWLRMTKLEGAIDGHIKIRDGYISDETKGKVKANHINFKLGPYTSRSTGLVRWDLNNQGLKLNTSLNNYRFYSEANKDSFMKGKSLRLQGITKSLKLRDLFSRLHDLWVGLYVEKGKITDLSVINDFIPVTDRLKVHQGQAELDAKIYLSTTRPAKKGYFKLKTSDAKTQFRKTNFAGNAELECSVRDSENGIDVFEITDTELSLNNVNVLSGKKAAHKKIKNWKGYIQVPKAYIRPKYNVIADGNFNMRFDNAEPMLIALGEEFRLFRVLRKIAAVDFLTGSGSFQVGPKLLTFEDIKLNSSDVDLIGRYQFFENQHKFLLWFKYDTLKAAIEYNGKKSSYAVNNTQRWYKQHGLWPKIEIKPIAMDERVHDEAPSR